MSIKTKLKFILCFTVLMSFLSCDDLESSENISKESPKITIRLVDAPGDYEAVNVEIVDVMIRMDDAAEDAWTSLEVESETVNLLDFTGGFNKVLVDQFPIPAGTLSQIRLVLGNGNSIVIKNENDVAETFDLKTPSAQQSGLKVKVNTVVEQGFTYDFVLDFDVEKSIVHAGNSENIILKPVLYASAQASSGIIQGTVSPNDVLSVAKVLITDENGDYEISAFTDENGAFSLWGVPAGTYVVTITPSEENSQYAEAVINEVEVVNGQVTSIAETVVLMLKPASISGIISGLANDVVATISINNENNSTTQTNVEGAYNIENLTPGTYKITISAPGYTTQEIETTLEPAEAEVINATLQLQ